MSGLETGLARTFDPDTSQAAARSVDATTLEEMVLSALRRDGGMTTWELSLQLRRKAIVWEAVPPEAVQQTLVW